MQMLGGTGGLWPWPCMKSCGPTETSNSMLLEYDSACKVCMMMAILLVLSWSLYTFLSIIQFFFQVQRHLSKLFDNLAKMKFQLDSEQKPTKIGLGMYSREEEYVSFSEHCDCSGQVRRKPCASELSGGVCSPAPYLDFCRQDGVELQYSSFVIQRLEEVVV